MLAAEELGEPFLAYRDGEGEQRIVPLRNERLSVGREPGQDLSLPFDPAVSRLHALFERLGESWTVLDDEISRNGTFVNGGRLRGRRRLHDLDLIRFGVTDVLFRDPAAVGEGTEPAGGATEVAVSSAQRRVLVELCRPLLAAGEPGAAPPSNAEIAAALTLSVEAVRTQLKALFKLFEVPQLPQNRKRAELARRALRAGIVMPRDLRG